MSIDAIKNNNDNNNKMSYIGATTGGAICGYALKYAFPESAQEKTLMNNDELKQISKTSKINEIESIKSERPKAAGADEFIKIIENKKNLLSEIKKSPKDLQLHLKTLLSRVNKNALITKAYEKDKIVAYTKHIRSTGIFIAIGAFFGIFTAIIHNINISNKKQSE